MRKLLRLLSKKTLHSGMEFISEFPKKRFINHNQNPFLQSFLLFLLVWGVCKSF